MRNNKFQTCKAGLLATVVLLAVCGCDHFKTEQARLEEARSLYREGDYNTAAIELKKLLRSDEHNIEARVLLGNVQLWLGQSRQAESQFSKAVKYGAPREELAMPMAKAYLAVGKYSQVLNELPPDMLSDPEGQAELRVLRGRAYKALSQSDQARAEFKRALDIRPDFAQAYLGLAEVSLAEQDYVEADRLIERVDIEDAAYPDALLLKSRILMEQGRYADAEMLFAGLLDKERVVLSPMQEFRVLTGLAEAQFRQGKMDVAIKSVNNLERRYPRHPMPKYMVALVEYARGNYTKAVSYLQSILQIAPNYPSAQFLIGASNYALNNLEQASFYLSRAVDVEPENRHAQKLLAMTYMRLNEPGKAQELLRRSMLSGDAGDNSDLLMMLGKVSLQSGNIDAGLDYIERSVESGGGDEADLQMELAAAYIASGKPALGVHVLEKLPDDGKYGYRKGVLEVMAGIESREISKAQEKAKALLQEYPDDPLILSLAGNAYLLTGEFSQAEHFYELALGAAPENPDVMMNMGRLNFLQGNAAGATEWFRRVLDKRPADVPALIALAEIAESERRYQDAEKLLLKVKRENAGNNDIALALLRLHLQQKNFKQARELALSVLEESPGRPEAVSGLAAALLGENKVVEAEKTLEDAVRTDNKSVLLLYNLARVKLQAGKPEDAKKRLEQALTRAPDSFVLAAQLAFVESRMGNFDSAISIIEKMKKNSPESPRLLSLEGDVLMQQKNYRRAVSAYEAAVTLQPTTELLVKLYGATRAAGAPPPEERFRTWLKQYPDDTRIRMLLAEHYQANGDSQAAIGQYEKVVERTPDNVLALNNLAWLYHSSRNPQAVGIAEKAHRLRPEKGEIADTLGWILVEQNELDRGIELLRDAASKAPEVLEIKYHLAAGLYKQGETGNARDVLAELLADERPFPERDAAERLYQSLQ